MRTKKIIEQGVHGVKYVKYIIESCIKKPPNFDDWCQVIEYRKDPLTGKWSRINPYRMLREKIYVDENFLQELFTKSERNCPFCIENIQSKTPKFKYLEIDRYFKNSIFLFPNMYPFALIHSVLIPDVKNHYKMYYEVTKDDLIESINLCLKLFKDVYNRFKDAKFISINMNFLFPSGASIPHIHFQIIQDIKPTWFTQLLIQKSKRYFKKFNSNFWNDLIESELMFGSRIVFRDDLITWFTSYSPIANGELIGVLNIDKSSILQFTNNEIEYLANSLLTIFKRLKERLNAYSINMSFIDSGFRDMSKYFRFHIRIVIRKGPMPGYTNDFGFMEVIHQEPVITLIPEELAKILR